MARYKYDALEWLEQVKGPEAAWLAAAGAIEDPDSRVRRAMARALGRSGDPEAVPCLERLLGDDGDGVRVEAEEGAAGEGAMPEPGRRSLRRRLYRFMLVWHRRTVLIGTSSNNAFKYESNWDYAEMRSIRDQIWRNRDALAAAGD
jgi:hypothetical protein